MGQGLTDNDMDRIEEYLQTPAYDRNPEQLLPGAGVSVDEGTLVTDGSGERES